MDEYSEIGNLDMSILKNSFNIKTDRVIITKERVEHIKKRHKNDFELYGKYMENIISNPDYILQDIEHVDTVLYLKNIEELNLQMVIKLQTENEISKANTVITFWKMRKRSYQQIIKKNKIIFKRIDKNE